MKIIHNFVKKSAVSTNCFSFSFFRPPPTAIVSQTGHLPPPPSLSDILLLPPSLPYLESWSVQALEGGAAGIPWCRRWCMATSSCPQFPRPDLLRKLIWFQLAFCPEFPVSVIKGQQFAMLATSLGSIVEILLIKMEYTSGIGMK